MHDARSSLFDGRASRLVVLLGAGSFKVAAMSLPRFFENYFFKIRYIYEYRQVALNCSSQVLTYHLDTSLTDLPDESVSDRLRRLIDKRKGLRAWRLFIFSDDGEIKGYSFVHTPEDEEWNDALPTHPKTARLSSTYVEPEYRGLGIRGKILSAQFAYCQQADLSLWSVIEKSNTSSIRSTEKSGGVRTRTNYLIKVVGRNVLSICTKPLKIYVLIGRRRARL